jgi:hypothetical protein
MIKGNEAGSVLFRNHTMENAQPEAVSNIPIREASPPSTSSPHPVEKGGSAGLWGALLAIAVALAALAGYDYWFMRKAGFSFAEPPNPGISTAE